jgi:hypothetical protein
MKKLKKIFAGFVLLLTLTGIGTSVSANSYVAWFEVHVNYFTGSWSAYRDVHYYYLPARHYQVMQRWYDWPGGSWNYGNYHVENTYYYNGQYIAG